MIDKITFWKTKMQFSIGKTNPQFDKSLDNGRIWMQDFSPKPSFFRILSVNQWPPKSLDNRLSDFPSWESSKQLQIETFRNENNLLFLRINGGGQPSSQLPKSFNIFSPRASKFPKLGTEVADVDWDSKYWKNIVNFNIFF